MLQDYLLLDKHLNRPYLHLCNLGSLQYLPYGTILEVFGVGAFLGLGVALEVVLELGVALEVVQGMPFSCICFGRLQL